METVETAAPPVGAALALWEQQQAVNAAAYAGFPQHSCSVAGHDGAARFRHFIDTSPSGGLRGRVLDIGCGPQPVPSYLEDYPLSLIAGVDPIAPTGEPHPFEFQHGRAESLIWASAVFDTVLAATSLDHVVDVRRVVQEARRVLRHTGRFFVWATLWPDAAPYDATTPPAQMADRHHVYHLGPWFLDVLDDAGFALVRRAHTPSPIYDFLEYEPV